MPVPVKIRTTVETWPIAGEFVIARGAKREATVVVAHANDGSASGRGECVPYARYGETVETVIAAIHAHAGQSDRTGLMQEMPAGAARNALDCALWDWAAKRTGSRAAASAGVAPLRPLTTAFTISLAEPAAMATRAAEAARTFPLLKIKLGGAGDAERMRQVRAACPSSHLIADANEAWTETMLPEL